MQTVTLQTWEPNIQTPIAQSRWDTPGGQERPQYKGDHAVISLNNSINRSFLQWEKQHYSLKVNTDRNFDDRHRQTYLSIMRSNMSQRKILTQQTSATFFLFHGYTFGQMMIPLWFLVYTCWMNISCIFLWIPIMIFCFTFLYLSDQFPHQLKSLGRYIFITTIRSE